MQRSAGHLIGWILAVGLGLCSCLAWAEEPRGTRAPILAGAWYPSDPGELRRSVQGFLDAAGQPPSKGKLLGLIAPHAGHAYSGKVAGHAYKLLMTQGCDTVVVLAPSHRVPFQGVSVYDAGGFATPLGVMELDKEFIAALKAKDARITFKPEAHDKEHAVEIQVPFLQVALPKARLAPLVMAEQNSQLCREIGAALAAVIRESKNKKVCLIASSDLSHYHDRATAKRMDAKVLESVERFDPDFLVRNLAEKQCEACGGAPILTIMHAARALGGDLGQVLAYGDSGDSSGDLKQVVGYLAAAFWSTGKPLPAAETPKEPAPLPAEDRASLHRIAREAVQAGLERKPYDPPAPSSERLKAPGAAFVTLKKCGELRGCIGHVIAQIPLYRTVADMARAAAFQDPRFTPVTKGEFKELSFEISVMSPLQRISDPKQVQVGKHGLIIRKGGASGLLLPQVATEYGWDREAFLENTCRKAGLPSDAWKEKDAEIYVFSAEVF
jgi:AmmeMemoRadiSam system protein B/AmmeMemoRadiSam system protein A